MSVPAQDPQVLPSDKGVDSAPAPPDTEQSTETDDMSIDNDGVKDATSIPLYLYGYSSRDNDTETEHKGSSSTASGTENTSTGPLPLLSRSENLCVRHQRMADEGANARLQKRRRDMKAKEHTNLQSIDGLSLEEKEAVNTVWSLFSSSPHSRRALILRGILTMCCFSQLSLLSSELAMAIRIDPFSLFPREVSLRVLSYLDAISLGRAAQVSKLWRSLADNDLLWRNMCEQHIERKCEKCGWGLPRLRESRGHAREHVSATSAATSDQELREAASAVSDGSLRRSVTAAANAAALERRKGTDLVRKSEASSAEEPDKKRARLPPSCSGTRPWKAVYCERLAIERNWRYGRYSVQVLRGHSETIMCLAFREKVTQLPYPVLITGGYDRTIRVWNLATGETLRVLTGHARGVRCLQFDDCKLITGSMDRTLKIWNWRTGELLRTLEGHTEGIVSLCFNDNMLVSGSADSSIRVWNFHTGECFPLYGHRDWINSLQLWSGPSKANALPGMFLFSASDDFSIRLWDLQHRECIMMYKGHVGQVQSLKIVMMDTSTVRKLAKGSMKVLGAPESSENDPNYDEDETPPKGEDTVPQSQSFTHYANGLHNLPEQFFHSNDSKATRPSSSGTRRIPGPLLRMQQRLQEAQLVPPLPANPTMDDLEDHIFDAQPEDAESMPSGCKPKRPVLVSGSLDNTLKLWDIRTGRCFHSLFGHVEGVWSVDADTLRIVSASHDRTVKIWDRDTAQCQTTLVGHRRAVTSVALGDDKIISGSDDGDVRVWNFCPPRMDETCTNSE